MGNRAVVTFSTESTAPCIYLHWNGGRASIEAFLAAAKDLGMTYTNDAETMDALAEMLATHFFGCQVGFTVYRERYGQADTDNWDNGVYVLDTGLSIRERLYMKHTEEINPEKTAQIRAGIVSSARPATPTASQQYEALSYDDKFKIATDLING